MYVVFARKYRPERFQDVVGQQHITRTLQNAVRTGRVAHAYLFCGSRGVGKTTVARILAKALNCADGPTPTPCGECTSCRRIATGDDLDVMEIDGASNRGIDQVRELRQNVALAPAHSRCKVYYIDEVHMLTEPAFNALLKTLEEPPAHVKFIFSTTDPQKLPDTVKSRCQRFDFRRVPDREIVQHLQEICRREGLQVADGGLAAIARAARGGMRDALGALDQLAAFGDEVSMDDVHSVLGTVDRGRLTALVDALAEEDTGGALGVLDELLFSGTDAEDFADQFSSYLRDLLVAGYCDPEDPILAGAAADAQTLRRQSGLFTPEQFTYMVQVLREATLRARRDTTGRIALELAVIKMSRMSQMVSVTQALDALADGGGPSSSPGAPGRPAVGASSDGAGKTPGNASGGGKTTGGTSARLKRMQDRLNNIKRNGGPTPAATETKDADTGAATATAPPPSGRTERKGASAAEGGRADQEEKAEPTEPDADPAPETTDAGQDELPEGMSRTTYRQLLHSAEEPEVAVEALKERPLLKAFIEADRVLGLNPLKVERRPEETEDVDPSEDADGPLTDDEDI